MNIGDNERALVLFSGGQDSTTCLAWALERFARVETIGFDYGQRNAVELACRGAIRGEIGQRFPAWAERLGSDRTIDLGALGGLTDSALTGDSAFEVGEDGLPNTFVPGRNLIFLAFAAAAAYPRGVRHLVGGMSQTDFSGYPDCRDATVKAVGEAIDLGLDTSFEIHTPLMWIDKAATWALAESLGGESFVDLVVEHTHSCYRGDRAQRHSWGYGCADCAACALRANGYQSYRGSETSAESGAKARP